MSKQTFRVGDLCRTHKGYNPSLDYLSKIINIIDNDGKEHYEYDVVTGNGELNSKLKLKLKAIATITGNVYNYEIIKIEEILIDADNMHDVNIINIDDVINKSNDVISNMDRNIMFFKRYRNRIDKLEILLSK